MKQDTPTPLRNSLIKDVIHVYTLGAHHVLVKILGIPLVLLGGASFYLSPRSGQVTHSELLHKFVHA